MRAPLMLGLATFAIGCGDQLNESDSQSVQVVMSTALTEVASLAAQPPGQGKQSVDLALNGDNSSWTVAGSITDGAIWTGVVFVDGTASVTGTNSDFAMTFDFQDVKFTVEDFTVNGTVMYDWSSSSSSDGTYTATYDVTGNLEVTGSVEGTMEYDYSFDIIWDGSAFSYEWAGTINGYSVEEWNG